MSGVPAGSAGWRRRGSVRLGPLLACALVAVVVSPVGADPAGVAPLVGRLGLVGYVSGTRPPPFSGATLEARPLSLHELSGRVVLLSFWATWCVECRAEMPVLERLHQEFGRRGLAVVGINAREDFPTVGRYVADLGLSFPVLLDLDGAKGRLYGVVGIPTTVIVGRDGRAVAFGIGPRDWISGPARALIEALLAETAHGAP